VTPERARRILGVPNGATWPEIRARHRAAIREAHPDHGGDAAHAAEINAAYRRLREAASAPPAGPTPPARPEQAATGHRPSSRTPAAPSSTPEIDLGTDRAGHPLDAAQVFDRLGDAAARLGAVTTHDAARRRLVVEMDHDPATVLTVAVTPAGAGLAPTVEFVLECADGSAGPELSDVVARLVRLVPER